MNKREQVKEKEKEQPSESEANEGGEEEKEWGGITVESAETDAVETHEEPEPEPSSLSENQVQDNEIDIGTLDPEWLSLNLDSWMLKGLLDQGFVKPTPIQSKSIPFALQNRDVIGIAQTVCLVQTPLLAGALIYFRAQGRLLLMASLSCNIFLMRNQRSKHL
jgi:hypothetical protein